MDKTDTLTIENTTKTLLQWATESGISTRTINSRLTRGWDPREAVFKTPRKKANAHSKYCECSNKATYKYGSDWICERCRELMSLDIHAPVGIKETPLDLTLSRKDIQKAADRLGVPRGCLLRTGENEAW